MLGLLLHLLTESDAPPVERRYQYVRAIHRQTLTSLARARQDPRTHPRMLIALERDFCKTDKEVNKLTITPATVLSDQMERHLEVGQSNYRFDTVFQALVEQVIVKL